MRYVPLLLAALFVFTFAAPASATAPGDPCTAPRHDGTAQWEDGMILVCDGSTWIAVGAADTVDKEGQIMFGSGGSAAAPVHVWGEAIIGNRGLACGTAQEGALRYTSASDSWEYCDGATWLDLASGSGTPAAAGADRQVQFNSSGAFGADANFVFDSTGRLGIGTATPPYKLSVDGFASTVERLYLRDLNDSSAQFDAAVLDSYVWDTTAGSESSGLAVKVKENGAENYVADFSNRFYLYRPINLDANWSTAFREGDHANGHWFWMNKSRGTSSAPTAVQQNDELGVFAFAGYDGSVWADASAKIWAKAAENFSTSGVGANLVFSTKPVDQHDSIFPRMTIQHDGNVGIGDTTPDHLLDVAGNIGMDAGGYLNFGDTDGSGGYGVRDNAGVIECKDSGGSWGSCGGAAAAGSDREIQFNSGGVFFASSALVFDNTGQLGIGISSPTAYLDVDGYNASDKSLRLRSGDMANESDSSQIVMSYAGSTNYSHAIKTRHNSGMDADNAIDFFVWDYGTDATGDVGTNHVMTVDGVNGGSVGIAKTDPDHTLDVAGNIGITAGGYLNFGATDGSTGYGIRDNAGVIECKDREGSWSACTGGGGGSPAGSDRQIQFNDAGSFGADANFVFDSVGRLGIGTSSPSQKLHVVGPGSSTLASVTGDSAGWVALGVTASDSSGAHLALQNSTQHWNVSTVASSGNFEITDITNSGRKPLRIEPGMAAGGVIYMQSTGNVGIGTDSPDNRLHIRAGNWGGIRVSNSADAAIKGGIRWTPSTTYESRRWLMFSNDTPNTVGTGNDGGLMFRTNNGSSEGSTKPRMVITGAGNVGIGTSSPSRNLSVYDTSGASFIDVVSSVGSESGIIFGDTSDATEAGVIYDSNLQKLNLRGYDNSDVITLDSAGNVGIGTSSPADELHVSGDGSGSGTEGPAIRIGRATGPRIVAMQETADIDSQGLAFFTHPSAVSADPAVEMVRIDKDGNVGIGTASPGAKLDVNGTVRLQSFAGCTALETNASGDLVCGTDDTGSGGDNLGDHTATQNVLLNGNWLSNDGANEGVFVEGAGNVGIGTASPTGVSYGTGDSLHVYSADDPGMAQLSVYSAAQGTGMVYVGQSVSYGGGITYNGDDNPDMPTSSDDISIFRRSAGTDVEVLSWSHNSSQAEFRGNLGLNSNDILGAGNVGIGTTAPGAPLDIAATSGRAVEFDNGDAMITIHDGTGNFNVKAGVDETDTIVSGSGGTHLRMDDSGLFLVEMDESTAAGSAFTQEMEFMMNAGNFTFTGGNVGIGTTAPSGKLEVVQGTTPSYFWRDGAQGFEFQGDAGGNRLRSLSSTGNAKSLILDATTDAANTAPSAGSNNIILRVRGSEKMRINAAGNVGIGDTTPDAKLDVNGNIIANDPSASNHVATKNYVDNNAGGAPTCTRRSETTAGLASVSVSCNTGEIMTGGGCALATSTNVDLYRSYPSDANTWSCNTTSAVSQTAYAICCAF